MAQKKKAAPKKRKTKKKTPSKSLRSSLFRGITGIFILVLLVVSAALMARYVVFQKPSIPSFEIYPKEEIPPRVPKPEPVLPGRLPRVVIIIDDLGYDRGIAQKFIDLDGNLTFSVLPNSPFRKKIAAAAHAKGHETMLHLPMEPFEYPVVNPGPGVLLSSMSPDELISQLEKHLKAVPYIKGVNNHMGSKITSTSTQMYQIFSILKKKKLYFIDSRTTANSLCRPSARLLQLPFAERDIFLDNVQEPVEIRKQVEALISLAKKHGSAVGIAHPHPTTYTVLQEILPEMKKKVHLVPASQVVHIVG